MSAEEGMIRLTAFFGIFILMAVAELIIPRKKRTASKRLRWLSNISITTVNTFVLPYMVPILAVAMAIKADTHNWGLMNYFQFPEWVDYILSILIFDCLIYWQHVLFHKVPILWRLHRVHHSDVDLDVTSGARFHTIEIILSMYIKLGAIIIFGPPAMAIMLFEIILNGSAMFNHSNVKIPLKLDRFLRLFLVTPDMHRVHHSVHREETDSNYGFNLPWWDYLFRTYTPQPRDGHEEMMIGLHEFRDSREQCFDKLMVQPFKTPESVEQEAEANSDN